MHDGYVNYIYVLIDVCVCVYKLVFPSDYKHFEHRAVSYNSQGAGDNV